MGKKGVDKLVRFINKSTFNITISTKDNQLVPYTIDSKDQGKATIVLQLNFKDPKTISSTTVNNMPLTFLKIRVLIKFMFVLLMRLSRKNET